MTLPGKYLKNGLILLFLIFLLVNLVLLFLTFVISFDSIQPLIIKKLGLSEESHLYKKIYLINEKFFNGVIRRLRIVSSILSFSILFCIWKVQWIEKICERIILEFPIFIKEIKEIIKKSLKNESYFNFALALIFFSGLVVRLIYLFQPMRYDEAYTFIVFSSRPLYYFLSYYPYFNNHIFHNFLQHICSILMGNSPHILRLPAFIAGVSIIPCIYLFTHMFYNRYAALLAAALVSSSSILIEYSTNARGYTLLTLIFLSLLCLAPYLSQKRNIVAWLLFALLSALGFYTIPIFIYPFAIIVVWLLATILYNYDEYKKQLNILIIFIIISFIITIFLYLPVIIVSWNSFYDTAIVKPISIFNLFYELMKSFKELYRDWSRDMFLPVKILIICGFFIAFFFHNKISPQKVAILPCIAVSILLLIFIQRVVPFARVWLFLLPIFFSMASAGIGYFINLFEKRSNYLSVSFSLLAILLFFINTFVVISNESIMKSNAKDGLKDAEKITLILKDKINAETNILALCPSDYPLIYYFYLHQIPTKHINKKLQKQDKSYIIVNKDQNDNIEHILTIKNLNINDLSYKIIFQSESAILYEII